MPSLALLVVVAILSHCFHIHLPFQFCGIMLKFQSVGILFSNLFFPLFQVLQYLLVIIMCQGLLLLTSGLWDWYNDHLESDGSNSDKNDESLE